MDLTNKKDFPVSGDQPTLDASTKLWIGDMRLYVNASVIAADANFRDKLVVVDGDYGDYVTYEVVKHTFDV